MQPRTLSSSCCLDTGENMVRCVVCELVETGFDFSRVTQVRRIETIMIKNDCNTTVLHDFSGLIHSSFILKDGLQI